MSRNIGAFSFVNKPGGGLIDDPYYLYSAAKSFVENDGGTVVSDKCLFETVSKIARDGELNIFQTTLLPAFKAGENGFLYYYQKPTFSNQNGVLFSANFTRANSAEVAAESGATVIDADGTLRKLVANEAPWSYPVGGSVNGCVKLLNFPEKNSIIANNEFNDLSTWTISGTGVSTMSFDWGKASDLFAQAVKLEGNVSLSKIFITAPAGVPEFDTTDYSIIALIAREDLGVITDYTGFDFGSNATARNTIRNLTDLGGGIYLIEIYVRAGAGNQLVLQQSTSQYTAISSAILMAGVTIQIGDVAMRAADIIASDGVSITRNSSLTDFNDIVNNAVFSNSGFSVNLNITDYRYDADAPAFKFFSGATEIFQIVSRDTGMTLYDVLNASTPDATKKATGEMVVTCDNQILKFYYAGAIQITHDLGASNIIDELKIGDANNYFEHNYQFMPFVLSESEAISKIS